MTAGDPHNPTPEPSSLERLTRRALGVFVLVALLFGADCDGPNEGNAWPRGPSEVFPEAGTVDCCEREPPTGSLVENHAGVCNMVSGELAPGCPLDLATICPNNATGVMYPGGCSFPFGGVSSPPMDNLDYVNVTFGEEFGVRGNLLRVADAAACSTTGIGWYFDDPVNPTRVTVCSEACACAQDQPGVFGVSYGCWVNAAPGAVDTAVECPRCAAARPKPCDTVGTTSYPMAPECEFPLPAGFEPSRSNVAYCQNCATAGATESWDGYLTYVPSLDDCDQVEEGWTLDMGTSPPTVRVCPSACSCAMANGAVIGVEHGCPRNEAPAR